MKPRSHRIWMTPLAWLAGSVLVFAEIVLPFGRLELSNNLSRAYFEHDVISGSEWDAQGFNSGSANRLRRVTLNLFRDIEATPSGRYWVRLHDDSGPGGGPGTNVVGTIATNKSVEDLSTSPENLVVFWGLSINMHPNRTYFIVVGAEEGTEGLRWGYTNDPVGANGFPAIFTYTADGGATWRTPFMNALPQRVQVVGDVGEDTWEWDEYRTDR